MVPLSRTATDDGLAEMLLFLDGNLQIIPLDLLELKTRDDVNSKTSGRHGNLKPELDNLNGPFYPLGLTG